MSVAPQVSPAWQDAKRILCVRLDAMGDFLMTTPAIRAIKSSELGREVTALVSPSGSDAAHHSCLKLMTPESVVEAVMDLTGEVRGGTQNEPRGLEHSLR